jgi:hypothetical protein
VLHRLLDASRGNVSISISHADQNSRDWAEMQVAAEEQIQGS